MQKKKFLFQSSRKKIKSPHHATSSSTHTSTSSSPTTATSSPSRPLLRTRSNTIAIDGTLPDGHFLLHSDTFDEEPSSHAVRLFTSPQPSMSEDGEEFASKLMFDMEAELHAVQVNLQVPDDTQHWLDFKARLLSSVMKVANRSLV